MNKYRFEKSQVVVYIYTDSALKALFPLFLLTFISSGNFFKSVGLELKTKSLILQKFYHTFLFSIKRTCKILLS